MSFRNITTEWNLGHLYALANRVLHITIQFFIYALDSERKTLCKVIENEQVKPLVCPLG